MRTGRPIAPLSLGVEERETLEGTRYLGNCCRSGGIPRDDTVAFEGAEYVRTHSSVFVDTQTSEPRGEVTVASRQARSSGDLWQRVSLELLDAFAWLTEPFRKSPDS